MSERPQPDATASPPGSDRKVAVHQRRKVVDIVSLGLIATVLFLVPLHRVSGQFFTYYREALMFLMVLLIPYYLFRYRELELYRQRETQLLLVWILYFILCYLFDPGGSIYGEDTQMASAALSQHSAANYVLRSFMLYVPLALLMAVRGISHRDLMFLMFCAMAASPYAIYLEYTSNDIVTVDEMIYLSQSGVSTVAYNTFAPYLTFPFAASIFVFLSTRSKVVRGFAVVVIFIDLTMIIYSQSRQSFLFGATAAGLLLLFTRLNIKQFAAVVVVVTIGVLTISSSPIFTERYLSPESYGTSDAGAAGRAELFVDGIRRVETVTDWVFGRGFSSVVFSGPHNNYVRVLQRTGLIGASLTYAPFLVATWTLVRFRRRIGRKEIDRWAVWWLILTALLFTLYHSMFGYPHETAWSSHVVWAGMGLYLAYMRSQQENPVRPRAPG